MDPTVAKGALVEGRSSEKEKIQLANALRTAVNISKQTLVQLTTTGTFTYTTIWTSEEMPIGAAWAIDISVMAVAALNNSRFERAAFFARVAVGGAVQMAPTADYFTPMETDPATDAIFQTVGNTVTVQVRDNGGAMNWDVVITAREVTT